MKICDVRVASTEVKKQFTGGEAKQATENRRPTCNVSICDELKDARIRLKPVKPTSVSPSRNTGVSRQPQDERTQERKNYTHLVNISATKIFI